MALLNPVKKLINVGKFGGRVASAVRRRYIQASSKQEAQACERAKETVKQGVNEAKEVSGNMKSKTHATANQL
ncbi:hypothetical protein Gohar_001326, partial [Gossypium harknessii]|nr:hypothetical protein [Gossypium harknessii]